MQFTMIMRRGFLWGVLFFLSLAPLLADVDTDGDGVTDADELAEGTDPNNSQSVKLRVVASWRFSDSTFNGDDGQQPIAQNNAQIVPNGFNGPGVRMAPNGSNPVMLKYRAVEASGKPNISPTRGSILLHFKPSWSSGVGPGSWVTLVQATNFALRIKPDGSALVFTNMSPGSTYSYQIPIDIGTFGFYWSYGLFTYSPEETSLSWDAPSTRVVGAGLTPPANLNDPNNFISFGSAADGTGVVNGYLDEIVTFNGSAVLSTTPVSISAIASNSPVGINLVWTSATNAITEVKRRLVDGSTWGTVRYALGTNLFDQTVTQGERYEYNVNTRIASDQTGQPDDVGRFIKASVLGKPLHSRGKIILLVDNTITNVIEEELRGFMTNLVGDGWQVLRKDVPRHIEDFSSPLAFQTNYWNITNIVLPFVRSNYALFGPEIRYVLAVGHVPVAYTGTIADDGHTTSFAHGAHTGAWASDLLYGDVDGVWTDLANVTSSAFAFNWNVPGDGRLDQNKIPANGSGEAKLEMGVARIDLSYMTQFADSEGDLLKKYFRKNANFRFGLRTFAVEAMGIEYLAVTGNQPLLLANELLSKAAVLKPALGGDIFSDTRSLLFGVQSGPSFFDRINDALPGIQHTTQDIANGVTSTNCAFYYVRGSYFPDFNTQNNFFRALLGTTNGGLTAGAFLGLTTGWRAEGLGVGLTIGHEMVDVVNTWDVPGGAQSVRSMELMGDPTLHFPIATAPGAVSAAVTNNSASLKWAAASGAAGYYVYRSTNGVFGQFDLLTSTPLSTTNYTDSAVPAGTVVYMIRSAATATTGSGTFTNLSQGAFSRPLTSADPTSCCIADEAINEDETFGPVSFSIGEADGEGGLLVAATSSNPTLLPNANILVAGSGAIRTVEATPAADLSGTATVTIRAQSLSSTIVKTFTLTVNSANDPPVFTKGADLIVTQGAGAQTVADWATDISPGPANEAGQQVSFVVTNDSPFMFSVQPGVASDGSLTFTPLATHRGVAQVSVVAKDDGGTANSGKDASYPQVFTITVGDPQDTDEDGLPDDWEVVNGFDPEAGGDGTVDWDGDGMTNAQEFAAGTDPKDSGSAIRINSAASQSPTVAVNFNTVEGKTYAVEFNDAFPTGEWATLASPVAGTGSAQEELDSGAGDSTRRVYRVVTSGLGGEEIVTEQAGLVRLTCLGNSDTILSAPFFRPAAAFGSVVAVNDSVVQVRGPSDWETNQWVYASGTQSNTYFMLVRSGALRGESYTITANGTNTLTLDLEGGTLGDLEVGASVAVVPYWTLGTLFHGGEGVHASSSPLVRRSEVLFPDLAGVGVNLTTSGTYYFWDGAWRRLGKGTQVWNDQVILKDMFVLLRHNVATNTTLTVEGAVLPGRVRAEVRRNATGKQDNVLALSRPVAVSLNDAGLVSSGAFRSSSSPLNRLDELYVFDNSIALRNKPVAGTYYYWDNAWRKFGDGAKDHGNDLVFQPGTGVIIRAGSGSSTAWSNDPTY